VRGARERGRHASVAMPHALVGTGSDNRRLEELVQGPGIDTRPELLEVRTRSEVGNVFARAEPVNRAYSPATRVVVEPRESYEASGFSNEGEWNELGIRNALRHGLVLKHLPVWMNARVKGQQAVRVPGTITVHNF
jgi:hypothetical protein